MNRWIEKRRITVISGFARGLTRAAPSALRCGFERLLHRVPRVPERISARAKASDRPCRRPRSAVPPSPGSSDRLPRFRRAASASADRAERRLRSLASAIPRVPRGIAVVERPFHLADRLGCLRLNRDAASSRCASATAIGPLVAMKQRHRLERRTNTYRAKPSSKMYPGESTTSGRTVAPGSNRSAASAAA